MYVCISFVGILNIPIYVKAKIGMSRVYEVRAQILVPNNKFYYKIPSVPNARCNCNKETLRATASPGSSRHRRRRRFLVALVEAESSGRETRKRGRASRILRSEQRETNNAVRRSAVPVSRKWKLIRSVVRGINSIINLPRADRK